MHRVATRAVAALAFVVIAGPTAGCNADEKGAPQMTTTKPAGTNRLINATSPYLLQHAYNPVDWYEWGPEALEKAKREDKPIFLSIGYSACHWCHVMAHESFENEEIAAIMNEHFVSIKVDREERPDLDEIYMQATMILNRGHGGWPMSVWLTPDLKPFFAGTYFPPTSRWGRPGFRELCERIGELWQTKRDAIEADAARLTRAVQRTLTVATTADASFTFDLIDRTVTALAGAFDRERGGITGGGTNKFPPSMALDLFLRSIARNGTDERTREELRQLVELTLDRMAFGGIYDQLGGGIHRYSTDVEWLVPHFEKMLYDQALVSRIYIDAYQFTHKPLYARIAREIFDYVIGDLQSDAGSFFSTRDADSEGAEGKYYVWTKAEILQVLGQEDGELFCGYYDVSDSGNWNDRHAPGVPKNILHVPRDLAVVAKLNSIDPRELE
ncbi:MAG: thioredoxin domain-containing protein, partial [Phycisphaerae bacterium]